VLPDRSAADEGSTGLAGAETDQPSSDAATSGVIRGSSLLLVGRVVATGLNLVTQVLIVRYLAKSDYGAFAYALSIAQLVEAVVTLGLDRAIPRFLPVFDENRDDARLFGTLLFVVASITTLGVAILVLLIATGGWPASALIGDPVAVTLTLILIVLAPLGALDAVLMNVFAVFANARTIFVRRFVLAPTLKLAVVLAMIGQSQSVAFLAGGYVIATAAGIVLYLAILVPLLRRRPGFGRLRLRSLSIPFRRILGYSIPLLTTDLLLVLMTTTDVLILGFFHGTEDVAGLRAVFQPARTVSLVMASFAILFAPAAARLFARGDRAGIRELYWRNAVWATVLSFPIFAVTFSLSESVTTFLFGESYRDSAILLAILALGRFVDASLGNNGHALQVIGRVRTLAALNVGAAVFNVGLNLALIPPFGAVGAAGATLSTFVAFNAAKQIALDRAVGTGMLDRRYVFVYGVVAAAAGLIWITDAVVRPPIVVGVGLVAVVSVVVVRLTAARIEVAETFPELLRLPFMPTLLGRPGVSSDA
jgi:O-antigen/teichoic acid export membrane protein